MQAGIRAKRSVPQSRVVMAVLYTLEWRKCNFCDREVMCKGKRLVFSAFLLCPCVCLIFKSPTLMILLQDFWVGGFLFRAICHLEDEDFDTTFSLLVLK